MSVLCSWPFLFCFLQKRETEVELAEALNYFLLVSNVGSCPGPVAPGAAPPHATFVIFL